MRDDLREASARGEERSRPAGGRGDRICSKCGVKLSAYNPGPNCWSHTIGHPWRGPSARPKF